MSARSSSLVERHECIRQREVWRCARCGGGRRRARSALGASNCGMPPMPTSPTVRPAISPRPILAHARSTTSRRRGACRRRNWRICRNTVSISPERVLRHCAAVGAWHVAHRDAAVAGAFEIDRVHADTDLLHESQSRRRVDDLGPSTGRRQCHNTSALAQQLEQTRVFRLGAHRPRRARRTQTISASDFCELGSGRVVVDHLHFRQNFPESVERDALGTIRLSDRDLLR